MVGCHHHTKGHGIRKVKNHCSRAWNRVVGKDASPFYHLEMKKLSPSLGHSSINHQAIRGDYQVVWLQPPHGVLQYHPPICSTILSALAPESPS